MTVRQFIRQSPAGQWWLRTTLTFAVVAVVAAVDGVYWLAAVSAVSGAYCVCWIVSTARYGNRWFRVWRLFFPIKDWD